MRLIGAALPLAAVILFARGAGSPGGPDREASVPSSRGVSVEPRWATQGVGSCASMACHHNPEGNGVGRNEYTTWSARDPHARAYVVLFDEPARQIIQNLQGPGAPTAATNLLCLNCHVQPGLESVPSERVRGNGQAGLTLADGVGCEVCHGPAEKWLKTHYLAEWKGKRPEEKAALGLRDTKDLVVRAQVCVTCHVGGQNAEVNHSLIAAGHPRLRFEYGAYLANLPKHWDEAKDRSGRPHFDIQAWAAGQIVSMQAALQLLEHRASTPDKPWPELAEYDCFACHHTLADSQWRRDPSYLAGQAPGSFPWGSWYYPMAGVLAEHAPQKGLRLPESSLKELRRLMEQPYAPGNRREVARRAADAVEQLATWLPGLSRPDDDWDITSLGRSVEQKVRLELRTGSWDRAAQLYLALLAQRPVGRAKHLVNLLWRNLEFPAAYESPRGFDPYRLGQTVETSSPPTRR